MPIHSVNALAGRYLRSQLKRTLLTILGVVLSVALVCASGLFGAALVAKTVDVAKQSYGSFYASIDGVSAAQKEMLKANLKVQSVGSALAVGYSLLPGSEKLLVMGTDQEFNEAMYFGLKAGKMPKTDHEMAVESWIGEDAGRPLHVGDTMDLTLALGGVLGPGGIPRTVRESFLITGLLNGRTETQISRVGYGVVTQAEAIRVLGVADPTYEVGFTVKKGLDIQKSIVEIGDSLGVSRSAVKQNTAVLTAMGMGSNASMNSSIINIELILALIIVLATVAVISNTFAVSVLERVRQFGVLRCVGATPGQIRRLVLREALVVSGLGIPLGIGSGIGAVSIVILVFNASGAFLSGMTLTLSWEVIVGSAGLGLLMVILSAWGPSARAGHVPPLEAVMAPDRFVHERARRRRHTFMAAVFGVSGRMAAQNLTRNRKRFFVTVASMTIGVALFITFSAFLNIVGMAAKNQDFDPLLSDVQVYARSREGSTPLTNADLDAVRSTADVFCVTATREANGALFLPEDRVSEGMRAFARELSPARSPLPTESGMVSIPLSLMGLDPAGLRAFKSHVVEGVFDPEGMAKVNGVYITRSFYQQHKGWLRPGELRIGDRLRVASPTATQPAVTVTIMGFLDEATYSARLETESLRIITTDSIVRAITGLDTWTRFDIAVTDPSRSDVVARRVRAGVGMARGAGVDDLADSLRQMRAMVLQISILLYGLVVVISVIGALNIINTIGTSIILRTRELGMLRAVGMSDGQMRAMVALEGVLYGLASSIPGTIVGLLLSRLLFMNVNSVQRIPWTIPVPQVAWACGSAILLGVLSSLVPLRRLGRQSVVESIRAEE